MGKNKKGFRAKANTGIPKQKNHGNGNSEEWVQELKNEKFEQYYKAQRLIPEEEWPKFMKAFREPLPTTFRLAGSRETAHELNNTIRSTYVPQLSNVTFEGETVPPPRQIPWYPDGLAWHLNVPKAVVRRSPEFKRFHNFLVYETDVGNISRQEAVSMIPPLFLDVQPHHIVLDMCAAPGSKTAQLLEAMHAPSTDSTSHIPPGLLIANDSDLKRTHLLVHQSSRLPSPSLLVTNLDASNYPNISVTSGPSSGPAGTLKFDRILCDVPCSGDGTLRKNLGIWRHWQPMDGNGLHSLQLRILLRAMKLLKPAGCIVYSTCSLNPVENEAVVAAALNASPDFELVDVSSQLPALIRNPGLEEWSPVIDKELTVYPTFEAFFGEWQKNNKHSNNQLNQLKMAETHWPPKDVERLNLTRCMRIYPHFQDMGGFFVAVLRRKGWLTLEIAEQIPTSGKRAASHEHDTSEPHAKRAKVDGLPSLLAETFAIDSNASQELVGADGERVTEEGTVPVENSLVGALAAPAESLVDGVSSTGGEGKKTAGKRVKGKEKEEDARGKFKEPPYTFLESDHPQLRHTLNRLELFDDFPAPNIFVRHPDGGASTVPLRSMYLCNDIAKRVVLANDYTRIRLVSAGTKIFTRQDAGSATDEDGEKVEMRQQFRVLDDAIPVLLPYIPPRMILSAGMKELRILLENYYPLIETFGEPFRTVIGNKENGNYLIRFDAAECSGAVLNHPIVLPLWKSNASASLMTDKKSKSALCLRVFGEDVTIAGKQLLEQQRKNQERRNAAAAAQNVEINETSSGNGTDNDGNEAQ